MNYCEEQHLFEVSKRIKGKRIERESIFLYFPDVPRQDTRHLYVPGILPKKNIFFYNQPQRNISSKSFSSEPMIDNINRFVTYAANTYDCSDASGSNYLKQTLLRSKNIYLQSFFTAQLTYRHYANIISEKLIKY